MRLRIVALFAVVALVLACGEGRKSRPEEPSPTPAPTARASGPVAISHDVSTGAVVAFGLECRCELLRLTGIPALTPDGALIVASGSRIERVSLDGGRALLHEDTETITGTALSHDGRLLAFSVASGAAPSSATALRVLDLESGSVREVAAFAGGAAVGAVSQPVPLAWRSDGGGFAFRYFPGHGPAYQVGVVMLDGTPVMRDVLMGHVSPDGKLVALDGFNTVGCLGPGPQRLRLVDLTTGEDIATAEDAGRGMVVDRWSPSGDALLYRKYATSTGDNDWCLPAYDASTFEMFVLPADGGAPRRVDDRAALLRAWHSGHDVERRCGDGAAPDIWGRCASGGVALVVDGIEVARGDGVRLLGVGDPAGG